MNNEKVYQVKPVLDKKVRSFILKAYIKRGLPIERFNAFYGEKIDEKYIFTIDKDKK